MDSSGRRNRHQRKLCEHCGENLSYSAYISHRRLYYDYTEDKWLKSAQLSTDDHSLTSVNESEPIIDVGDLASLDTTGNESDHDDAYSGVQESTSTSSSESDISDDEPIIIEEFEDIQDDHSSLQSETTDMVLLLIAFLLKFQFVFKISDTAIAMLLRFFNYMIKVIGNSFNIPVLQGIVTPLSIRGCHSLLGSNQMLFKEYVVCPTCHMLYFDPQLSTLVEGTTMNRKSALCKYVKFPNHPQLRLRSPCNTTLMNTIKNLGNKVSFKARKTYCYYGLKAALANLLCRPTFLNSCNTWKSRRCSGNLMGDFIDGKVWLEETLKLGNSSNVLGFLINIDWFQPFKDTSYSIGVIYIVIVNLPRNVRYKDENVIIVGVIPGPKEPSQNINSYLGPMVSELLELYTGIWFDTFQGKQFMRGILVCISSDIPATRKAAGFVGHKGLKGCSRCLKTFPTDTNKITDYSGYDRETWPCRTNEQHREYAYRELHANTKTGKRDIDHEYGARYSIFFELPYYNCIRFVVIDIMHNLFLGTAKHVMTVWKECNIISSKDFEIIQEKILKLNVPQDIGRIPHKIDSGMAGMTADQWKNWTCIYSLYALQGTVPQVHLDCWWLFVQACLMFCQPLINPESIDKGDKFILEFCKKFEHLYGPRYCTPNMHLHCHIADCLYDFGPAHATWCFSFERCNGILGSMPNNNKPLEVEKKMIKRFIQQMEHTGHIPQKFESDVSLFFPESTTGSVSETMTSANVDNTNLTIQVPISDIRYDNSIINPLGPMTEHALTEEMVQNLARMYSKLFTGHSVLHVSHLCRRFVRVKVAGTLYSSRKARSDRNSYICAYWLGEDNISIDTTALCRPGCVQYFIKHNVVLKHGAETSSVTMYLAYVTWYTQHPEKNYFLPPNTLWYPESTLLSEASFLPISRIACRSMQGEIPDMSFPERPYNNGKVIIINPISCANLAF